MKYIKRESTFDIGKIEPADRTCGQQAESVEKVPSDFSDKRIAACRNALAVRQRRTTRTFAGREVFSPTHMSPEKTNFI